MKPEASLKKRKIFLEKFNIFSFYSKDDVEAKMMKMVTWHLFKVKVFANNLVSCLFSDIYKLVDIWKLFYGVLRDSNLDNVVEDVEAASP